MSKNRKNKQNKRRELIEKIIREEIACSNEKFLVEASGRGTGMHRNGAEVGFTQGMGLRGGAATLPEPVQGREQDCVESDMGGCIDPPDLKQHFVESDISHEEEGLDDLGEPIQRFRGQRRPKSVVEPLKTESRKISGRLSENADLPLLGADLGVRSLASQQTPAEAAATGAEVGQGVASDAAANQIDDIARRLDTPTARGASRALNALGVLGNTAAAAELGLSYGDMLRYGIPALNVPGAEAYDYTDIDQLEVGARDPGGVFGIYARPRDPRGSLVNQYADHVYDHLHDMTIEPQNYPSAADEIDIARDPYVHLSNTPAADLWLGDSWIFDHPVEPERLQELRNMVMEIAQQSDQEDYGVDTTSAHRPEVGAADLDMNINFPDGGDSGTQAPESVGTASPGMGSKTNIDIKYSDDPLAFPLDAKDAFTDSSGMPSGVESKYLSEGEIKRLKLLTFGDKK